jgi:cell division protein FtsW (lipid II flippase)
VERFIPRELRDGFTPMVWFLLVWLFLVAWMVVQDNGSHLLDSQHGLHTLLGKALYVLVFVIVVYSAFMLCNKKTRWIVKVLVFGLAVIAAVVCFCVGAYLMRDGTPASEDSEPKHASERVENS